MQCTSELELEATDFSCGQRQFNGVSFQYVT